MGLQRGCQPLLLESSDESFKRQKLQRSRWFGGDDEEVAEGKGAPNSTSLSRVICATSHPGQHQGGICTQSQRFPHAVHAATMLFQENVRGTYRCDGLSRIPSTYIPGEPDKDKLSGVTG